MFYWYRSYHGNVMTPIRYQVFFWYSLKGACTSLRCLDYDKFFNNFYESVLKIFCNEVLRVIKMVSKHAIDIIG